MPLRQLLHVRQRWLVSHEPELGVPLLLVPRPRAADPGRTWIWSLIWRDIARGSGGMAEEVSQLNLEQFRAVKEQLEAELNVLRNCVNSIRTTVSPVEMAANSLNNLAVRKEGQKMLVPLTPPLYVPGQLDSADNVLVDVGTGYDIEKAVLDSAVPSVGGKVKKEEVGGLRLQKSAGSFMAGSIAGIISTAGLQPLEVIKTHMQAGDAPHGHSIRGAMKTVAERDGLRGFWRGTGPACVRIGFGAGLYFAMLGPMMSALQKTSGLSSTSAPLANPMQQEKMPASVAASAGALTRLMASVITCPITVIKTRMEYAAASGLKYTGTASALVSITRTEGLPGLYSGLLPTLVRDAPYSGLYLLLYTRVRYFLRENVNPSIPQMYINFFSGAFAGGTATLLTHPPDVVRTRLQLEKRSSLKILSTVHQIVKVDGLRGLFVGVVPRVGKRGLQQAFSWTIFEEVSRFFNDSF